MEKNNTLPTAEDFFDKYAQRNSKDKNWHNFLFFLTNDKKIEHIKNASHEYAVLFARHHVKKALRSAAENAQVAILTPKGESRVIHELVFDDDLKNECVCCADFKSIENAYPESEIK